MPGIRNGALALAAVLWHVGHVLTGPGALTIVSTAVLAAALIGLVAAVAADGARIARVATAVPLTQRAAGLREKSWSAKSAPVGRCAWCPARRCSLLG